MGQKNGNLIDGISTKYTVVRETYIRLNNKYSEEQISGIYDILFEYLIHLVKNTDSVGIYLPFIGMLHFCQKYSRKKIAHFNNLEKKRPLTELELKQREIYESRHKKIVDHNKEYKKTSKYVRSFAGFVKKETGLRNLRTYRSRPKNCLWHPYKDWAYTKKASIVEICREQNKIADDKKGEA